MLLATCYQGMCQPDISAILCISTESYHSVQSVKLKIIKLPGYDIILLNFPASFMCVSVVIIYNLVPMLQCTMLFVVFPRAG